MFHIWNLTTFRSARNPPPRHGGNHPRNNRAYKGLYSLRGNRQLLAPSLFTPWIDLTVHKVSFSPARNTPGNSIYCRAAGRRPPGVYRGRNGHTAQKRNPFLTVLFYLEFHLFQIRNTAFANPEFSIFVPSRDLTKRVLTATAATVTNWYCYKIPPWSFFIL